jgi:hypothetical protein
LLKNSPQLNISEEPMYNSPGNSAPNQVQSGNFAVHAAGYVAPELTYHLHQWITQENQPGGLDTLQIAYNNLFKQNGHLFVGKMSALPVPAPFSNQSDIQPYVSAELQVGEHMYQQDMMRWGTSFSYVRPKLFVQASWLGSNEDLGGSSAFANTDKALEWIAAYADPNRPLEAGIYGSVGSYPLAEGGVDQYHTMAVYAQRDPGPHFVPGILALYQWGYDANPGVNMSSMGGGAAMALPPANSTTETFELWEPVFHQHGVVALRQETTNNGLGNFTKGGNIDLSFQPFTRYNYLHFYLENALMQDSKPNWRAGLWWIFPRNP